MDLDLRQLRYFLEVASTKNITQAARTIGMSQPALSRQIRVFEAQFGSPLFARHQNTIALTAAGKAVVKEGQQIMSFVHQSLARITQEIRGAEIKIGYAPSLAEGLVAEPLARFSAQFPQVQVSWHDCTTQEMWDGLAAGELDFILEIATQNPHIHWQKLTEKTFCLAVPEGHPLASESAIHPDQLHGQRLLTLSRHDYPGYWEQITAYFASHGINAKVAGEFDGVAGLKLGTEAGLGLAFLVEGAFRGPQISMIPLQPAPSPLCVALGYRRAKPLQTWERSFLQAFSPERISS